MKIADVTYTGPMRMHYQSCPSGNTYTLKKDRPVAFDSLEDVKHLEDANTIEVDMTIHGEILRHTDGSLDDIRETVSGFGYRKKQALAKKLGVKANQSEEELEEALQEEVEQLQVVAENQ